MATTILIKQNTDKNYDRLFAKVEETVMFGRAQSESERETPEGYAVTFKFLDADVLAWVEERSKDFSIIYA